MSSQIEEFNEFLKDNDLEISDKKIVLNNTQTILDYIKEFINLIIKIVSLIEYYDSNNIRVKRISIDNNSKLNIAVGILSDILSFGLIINIIKNPILKIAISIIVQMMNHYNSNWKMEIAYIENDIDKVLEKEILV